MNLNGDQLNINQELLVCQPTPNSAKNEKLNYFSTDHPNFSTFSKQNKRNDFQIPKYSTGPAKTVISEGKFLASVIELYMHVI